MDKHLHHQEGDHDCCGGDSMKSALQDLAKAEESTQTEMEKLKAEILKEIAPLTKSKMVIPWGSAIVTMVLGILAIVSVVQAVESVAILKKIQSSDFKAAASPSAGAESPPNMVGGC
ncbi:MAG: hypothetical protein AAB673_03630 [Patescibacteria group bacterium]